MSDREGSKYNSSTCQTGKEVQITAVHARQGRKYKSKQHMSDREGSTKKQQHMSDREGSTNNSSICQTGKEVNITSAHVRQGRKYT